jgi:hypothetical protein
MSQIRAIVEAGACGFTTEIIATSEDDQHVTLAVGSPCEKIGGLAMLLPVLDSWAEITAGSEGALLATARANLTACCAGCVVPSAAFKAMQAAAGLALPQPVHIEFTRL